MGLLQALALPPEGWTCLVGGGGKSSLMLRLVEERARHGLPALAATTTGLMFAWKFPRILRRREKELGTA